MSPSTEIESIADSLVRRRLAVPAIFLLEAMKPLSTICQQTVLVTSPLAQLCGFGSTFGRLAQVLESREQMEELALEMERRMEETP